MSCTWGTAAAEPGTLTRRSRPVPVRGRVSHGLPFQSQMPQPPPPPPGRCTASQAAACVHHLRSLTPAVPNPQSVLRMPRGVVVQGSRSLPAPSRRLLGPASCSSPAHESTPPPTSFFPHPHPKSPHPTTCAPDPIALVTCYSLPPRVSPQEWELACHRPPTCHPRTAAPPPAPTGVHPPPPLRVARRTVVCCQGHGPGMWVRGVHPAACECTRRVLGRQMNMATEPGFARACPYVKTTRT